MNIYKEIIKQATQQFDDKINCFDNEKTIEMLGVSFKLQYNNINEIMADDELIETQAFGLLQNYYDSNEIYDVTLYDPDKYYEYFTEALKGIELSQDKRIDSRQMIVHFEQLHCFETLQFLIRQDNLYIFCNMRSCDFKNNFAEDVLLICLLSNMIREVLREQTEIDLNTIYLGFNIASLHIYK